MFLKSDAIVVGRRHVFNTSLSLRLYAQRYGLIAAVAKGAFRRRRRAEPPSVPDLFQRGEVVLWMKSGRETDFGEPGRPAILHEWSLDEFRAGLRGDYESFRAAAGCAALVAALSPGSDTAVSGECGEHFDALDAALAELDRGGASRPVLWAFVMRELERAGFLAPAGSCAICGCDFGRARGRARHGKRAGAESCGEAIGLAPGAGGFVCRSCRAKIASDGEGGEGGDAFVPLPPEAAAVARFVSASPVGAASKLKVSPRAASALERAVRALAEYHLERAMPALSPARELRTAGAG
jgi:recombinational DNA repair protein (RecF pathway)